MVSPEPASKPQNPTVLILVIMGIFLAGIASLAAYALWPRGKRVGVIDLRGEAPALGVDLAAGDTLSFRLDVTVGTASSYPNSSRSRTNAVHDELKDSALTVDLTRDGSAVGTTTCGAYDDRATTVSSGSDDVASSGLPLRCSLVAGAGGKYTLTARVVWVPKDIRAAKLTIHRQRAER